MLFPATLWKVCQSLRFQEIRSRMVDLCDMISVIRVYKTISRYEMIKVGGTSTDLLKLMEIAVKAMSPWIY